jgi:hypothetical protein
MAGIHQGSKPSYKGKPRPKGDMRDRPRVPKGGKGPVTVSQVNADKTIGANAKKIIINAITGKEDHRKGASRQNRSRPGASPGDKR